MGVDEKYIIDNIVTYTKFDIFDEATESLKIYIESFLFIWNQHIYDVTINPNLRDRHYSIKKNILYIYAIFANQIFYNTISSTWSALSDLGITWC